MSVPQEKVPADEFARHYGWPTSAVVNRIRTGIYDGVCEDGKWYVVGRSLPVELPEALPPKPSRLSASPSPDRVSLSSGAGEAERAAGIRLNVYLLVFALSVAFSVVSLKTGYRYRRYGGFEREREARSWDEVAEALPGELVMLAVVFLLIIGIVEFTRLLKSSDS